jgi:hypothetical protein
VIEKIKKIIMGGVDDTTMRESTSAGPSLEELKRIPHNNTKAVISRLVIGTLAACILVSLSVDLINYKNILI